MIEQFTKKDFEAYLTSTHSPFESLGLVDGEYAYTLPLDSQTGIIIRSSVKSDGLSAETGKDSIRCWLVADSKPLGSKVSKWTTRQSGWQDRLSENIKQLAIWRALAGDCQECGKPKGIFKARTEKNKGRPFAKCQEHSGFAWLDKPIKKDDIYFSEESYEYSEKNKGSSREIKVSGDIQELAEKAKPKGEASEMDKQQEEVIGNEESHNGKEEINPQTAQVQEDGVKQADVKASGESKSKEPNAQQKQAIEADINANLRVLAGPGSGKSALIEWRYEFLVNSAISPNSIVVCTFGKQAADSIGLRIKKRCPAANLEQICTINALCYRLLAKWYPDSRWYQWQGPKDWQIKKTLEDIVGPVWHESEKPSAQEVYSYINTSKYHGLITDDSYEWYVDTLGQQRGAWLYEIRSKFDAWLNRNRFLTFADQLFLAEQQLKNDASWRAMVQGRFSHVIVDESQDTNYQAMRILITISLEPGKNTVYESEVK